MSGTLYCAACIHEKPQAKLSGPVRGNQDTISEAVTTVVGTALCLEHARFWMHIAVRVEGVKP